MEHSWYGSSHIIIVPTSNKTFFGWLLKHEGWHLNFEKLRLELIVEKKMV